MGDLKLQGQPGLSGKETPIVQRKLPNVSDKEQAITQGNAVDESVVEDTSGAPHIVCADELCIQDGKLPKVGDKVNLPFLDDDANAAQEAQKSDAEQGQTAAQASARAPLSPQDRQASQDRQLAQSKLKNLDRQASQDRQLAQSQLNHLDRQASQDRQIVQDQLRAMDRQAAMDRQTGQKK